MTTTTRRPLHRLSPVLLLLALAAAACGDSDVATTADTTVPGGDRTCLEGTPDCDDTPDPTGGSTGDEPGPDEPVTHEPGDVPGPTEPSPRLVTPKGGTVNTRAVDWQELLETDDPAVVQVTFWGGVEPCFVVDRVEVDETATDVTITVYAGATAEAAQGQVACIEIAEYLAVEVRLEAPLGSRTVHDGGERTS